MKTYPFFLLLVVIGIMFFMPHQVSAITDIEFWNENGETVSSLNPTETYTLVFIREFDFKEVTVTFSLDETHSHWIYWNEIGYESSLWEIDESNSQINPLYNAQKITFTLNRYPLAGNWRVFIDTGVETHETFIEINKMTTYEVLKEVNDWGEYEAGGQWISNSINVYVQSNSIWNLIISATPWTNGSFVMATYTLNGSNPFNYLGFGNENLTLYYDLFLDGDANGVFKQTTSLEINRDVYDIDQEVRVGNTYAIEPVFNNTGNTPVFGYVTYDIEYLGGYSVEFEIAEDSNFYLLDHLELATTDDNGYYYIYLTANFSHWIRATVLYEGETYYSDAIMVQAIELEYELNIHIPKSVREVGETFIEEYGVPTAIGLMGFIGIAFAIGRRVAGSPL